MENWKWKVENCLVENCLMDSFSVLSQGRLIKEIEEEANGFPYGNWKLVGIQWRDCGDL